MARRRSLVFSTIRSEGGLLPAELLTHVASSDRSVPGTDAASYHLAAGEQLTNRITRSWNRLTDAWKAFATTLAALPESERAATTVTRERWLLPIFEELGYGRLQTAKAVEVEGRSYPVSHAWGQVPIHLVGARVPIDQRTKGVAGAAGSSPHALMQELLNRTEHLWGIVTNGLRLRLLRDNASLTRQAFVEFDLETMFADEVFDDFVVLWLSCHQSRVEGDVPAECWLEHWTKVAAETGTRAREDLRVGVEKAVETLGAGFVSHPANIELRERLRSGALPTRDYYRQLLRVVYRMLFLFVAEDRNLLHAPSATEEQRRRYARFYSLGHVRTLAERRRGGPQPDLWTGLNVTFTGLGRAEGIPALGLSGLGSFLWSSDACPDLDRAQITNQHLLEAVRHLAFTLDRDEHVLRPVDYHNLGTEELGAVYESLLEQHPEVNAAAGTFALNTVAGNERKTTGSYYTPTILITELLNSALDPVLAVAAAKTDPEAAILDLKVLDPACGSGHFLIAAAHRIAKRLASVRTGDDEPAPEATRTALREVVGRCLHGIDVNPMAVELCKVSLWMEAMEPGRPLAFLDHRILRGNALLGATPQLLAGGVPDEAFRPLTGDDKAIVSSSRRRNAIARRGQGSLQLGAVDATDTAPLVTAACEVDRIADDTVDHVAAKAQRWSELIDSPAYRAAVRAADTWCAAFVVERTAHSVAVTNEQFEIARSHPATVESAVREAVDAAAEQFGFLHWHLAFLDVYRADGEGGFDVVVGNPPWEKVQFTEKEFFAARAPEIANAPGAKRKALIAKLESEDPALWDVYRAALRQADGESHFVRASGRYPLGGAGKVNTYAVFAEAMRDALAPAGRLGAIVPTGIATDDTTKKFFGHSVISRRLVSLFSFENEAFVFPGVHHALRFCLLTIAGPSASVGTAEFAFFARHPSDLADPERRFSLSADDLALINPNTRTAPVFRSRRDAQLTRRIYRGVPVLVRDGDSDGNPWGVDLQQGLFNMTSDSHLFRGVDDLVAEGAVLHGNVWVRGEQRWLPLYEGKMVHQFTHRWGDYGLVDPEDRSGNLGGVPDAMLDDPAYVPQPRYWVAEPEVLASTRHAKARWLLGFRDITGVEKVRTMIAAVLPPTASAAHLLNPCGRHAALLGSVLNAFATDFIARFKVGGTHINFFVAKQLAVLPPTALDAPCAWASGSVVAWVAERTLELTYTAWDLEGFAADLGWHGPPFHWNVERRALLRAELDAAMFILYGLDRDDVDYVMDTFPIVRRNDEKAHGEYRTKRLILERYDALVVASKSGTSYVSPLDPPPAHPSMAHPESTRPAWASA